jgi:hypothetical protein
VKVSAEEAAILEDPALSLLAYGHVVDQATGDKIKYDPHHLTKDLQQTIVGYVSDPPKDDAGFTKWLSVLKPRQSGASTTAILAFYPKVAYRTGWNHITIADNQPRSAELHKRQMFCHKHWPAEIRTEQVTTTERRALTLENDSYSLVLSAHAEAVGIGRSTSSVLMSETAFWRDAGEQWSQMQPALINREFSMIVRECTPAPMSAPSAAWWRDECAEAKKGIGRFLYSFSTFWDSYLNRRPVPVGTKLDSEEEKLLEKYGKYGLTVENLMFRRVTMETDGEIRRDPELFKVYYPFDDVTCWRSTASAVIPSRFLTPFEHGLMPEGEGYTEFFPPDPLADYVIGVDPAGYGGRDHHAFQILETWSGEWRQVASFGGVIDPEAFADQLFDVGIRYNRAMINIERNGVGVGTIGMLKMKGYPRIWHDGWQKPGHHKHSDDEMTGMLVDALMGPLKIVGEDTYSQLGSYQADRKVALSDRSVILSGGKEGRGRRSKHHWDKVSALMTAVLAARKQPMRFRPVQNVILVPEKVFDEMSYDEVVEYERKAKVAGVIARKASRRGRRR